MSYSETVQSYVATAVGLSPNEYEEGSISITTTLGLDSGWVGFERPYVPIPMPEPEVISLAGGHFYLSLISPDTVPFDVYIAAVPSYGDALPGPLPLGCRLIGSAYTVRASGALTNTERPMLLRIYYGENPLFDGDPHTLAILAWDASNKRWDNLGATLSSATECLSVATRRFTTYALVATPAWRDAFDDSSGMDLSQLDNVTRGGMPGNWQWILSNTPGSGKAVSRLITPTIGFANWGSLTFTYSADPPTTTLAVDVLSLDGSEVLTDVASDTNLASVVDPAQHPSLRLRANMSSTVAGETPALEEWQLAWQVEAYKVYLPVAKK
jgi:hypothetical protein